MIASRGIRIVFAAVAVSVSVLFADAMMSNQGRDDSGRYWINAFGDIIGPNNSTTKLVYDLFSFSTTATNNMGSMFKTGPENFGSVIGIWKTETLFWDRFRGLVTYTDKLIFDLDYKLEFRESGRKTKFARYVLWNNCIDGAWLNLSKKDIFALEMVLSFMNPDTTNISSQYKSDHVPTVGENDAYVYGDEMDLLLGAKIDLDFLKVINNDVIKFAKTSLSWGMLSHYDLFAQTDIFRGTASLSSNAATNNVYANDYIILDILPYKSSDGKNFAAFYGGSVDFADQGIQPLDILVLGDQGFGYDNDNRGAKFIRIDEGERYRLTIPLSGITTTNVIKINLNLANSFYVLNYTRDGVGSVPNLTIGFETNLSSRVSSPNRPLSEISVFPPLLVLSSDRHSIRDFSNLKTYTIKYGFPTANHNFGLESEFDLLGIKMKGGLFFNLQIAQAPRKNAEYQFDLANAFYLQGTKVQGDLSLFGAVYRCEPDYHTDLLTTSRTNRDSSLINRWHFLVNDNEDDDTYSPWVRYTPDGGIETFESPTGYYDKNLNTVPDYFEDFVLFKVYPDIFNEGDDYNNNGFIDKYEDDMLPEYNYRENIEGVRGEASFKFFKGLVGTAFARYEDVVSSPDIVSAMYGAKLTYDYEERGVLDVNAKINYKRTWDGIIDDVSPASVSYIGGSAVAYDQLNYFNSDVLEFYFSVATAPVKDVTVQGITHLELNMQHNKNDRTAIRSGLLAGLNYKPAVNALFQKTPVLDIIFKNLTFEMAGLVYLIDVYYLPNNISLTKNDKALIGMYKLGLALSKETVLYHGVQYYASSSLYNPLENYEKITVIEELDMINKNWAIVAGLRNEIFLYTGGALTRSGNNTTVYVRLTTRT